MPFNQLFLPVPAEAYERIFGEKECTLCGGFGRLYDQVTTDMLDAMAPDMDSSTCPRCHGTGKQQDN